MAVTLVSRRTAPLEAGYIGLVMSVPTRPSCDEMLTIEPPPARRMAGMAALLPRNTPVALTSIPRCHASGAPMPRAPPLISATFPASLMSASRSRAHSYARLARWGPSPTTCCGSHCSWPGVLSYRRNVRRKDTTMANPSRVYVGVGSFTSGKRPGIFRRVGDGGWEQLTKGLPEATKVQAITIDPTNPDLIYIGTHDGPYRSRNGGDSWERLALPESGLQVWSVLVHPRDPRRIYVGTSPGGVFRSDDGGDTRRRLPKAILPERVEMGFPCRGMRPAAEPARPESIWAGREVGGIMKSVDGGEP